MSAVVKIALVGGAVLAAASATVWLKARPVPPPDTLVVVDGVPLTERDLQLRLRPDHQQDATAERPPEYKKAVLEAMIAQELAAKQAAALGLDADPEYQRDLAPLEAQVAAFKRKALADLWGRHLLTTDGAVTDAEARAFFDQHRAQLSTQVQVFQIMRRTRAAIEQAHAELQAAPSFEAYAQSQFPSLPGGERPWDLGFLRWQQLPEEWRDVVYGLKKGETSPVIQGQKDRFWILKLVETRADQSVTFETARPTVIEALQRGRQAAIEAKALEKLRAGARIDYVRAP